MRGIHVLSLRSALRFVQLDLNKGGTIGVQRRAVNANRFCIILFRFVRTKRKTQQFFVAFKKRNGRRNSFLLRLKNETQDAN